MSPGSSPKSSPRNSLGLSDQVLAGLFDMLDAEGDQDCSANRESSRWPFRHASVPVELDHESGSTVELHFACRNLSRTGAGMLHRAYVHPGTRCTVTLVHPDRGGVRVRGVIVRCIHRSGVIHELGVEFDHPIDLRSFIRPDPLIEWFEAESVKPAKLSGTVLYFEHNQVDKKLVRHYLNETKLRVIEVDDRDAAVGSAQQGVDLIMCGCDADPAEAIATIHAVRDENVSTPAIIIGQPLPEVVSAADGRIAHAVLVKPVNQVSLLRAIGEFLSKKTETVGRINEVQEPELLEVLRPDIESCASSLDEAVSSGEAIAAISACVELSQIMTAIGMAELADQAGRLIKLLSETGDVSRSEDEIQNISESCQRLL